MANTKKPEGLTVKRAGLKFTTKWKIRDKDYGNGQQFQYAIFTTQKKYESALNFIRQGFTIAGRDMVFSPGVTWHNVSVRSSSTSATVSLSAGSFFPTAKKPYLAGIIFRVRGNRKAYTEKVKYKDSKGRTKYRDVTVNPGWSAWAYKGFDITAPAAPKASVAWSKDYINRTTFSWDCGNEAQSAPYTRCVYQTVTALDYNGKVENIPAWKNAANNNVTSRQSSIYRDEADLADKNLTRAYRIKAIGPGGESAWRYARHPYGAPEEAVNVTCETTRNEAVGSYHLVIAWTAPNSVANPITKTTAEYLIAEPGGIVETEQGLLPTVPAQAQWAPFPATKDTNGANAFSFDLQETLGDDECLWVHVITTHDNHDTPSEAVLAAKGMLQKPTITNLETNASTHRAEITIQAGTSVPGAFHAIKYEPADGSSDPDAGKIIGIIPNGSTFAQIQCPAWTATPAFGVYAVLGEEAESYTRDDGVTIYTLNEVMTSAVESSGGNVPKAPGNVRASQLGTSDTIQVLWDVVWNEATGAEVSWADHADAWISTEQPQTFDVQNLRESVLNITGLELGKVWFIRVRLYQTNTGGTNIYGPYSDIIPVDLSTIPAVPDLQISDEDGIIPATGSTVASWVYVSEDGTRQKAATLAEVTYEDDEPVYTRLMGLTTQQQATLSAEALGWETGTQHEVAVQVTSESGNPSKWSAPVMITIADAISCSITQTSLEYDNVPVNPESYTGNPITFDTGEQEKEVASLHVELLPKQEGTPSQDSTVYNEPYLSKTSPNFNSEYDKLVGGTVAWNQLNRNGDFPNDSWEAGYNAASVTISNGEATFIANGTYAQISSRRYNDIIANHVYLSLITAKSASARKISAGSSVLGYTYSDTMTSSYKTFGSIKKPSTSATERTLVVCSDAVADDSITVKNAQLFDLTQMFGETIANYLYTLETGSAGAGVAFFRKLFPKPYYAYNAGQLMSVNASSHNTVGFNQLDPAKTKIGGAYNPTVGNTINLDSTGATYAGTNPIEINVTTAWRGCCLISEPLVAGQQYEVAFKTSAPTTADKRISQYLIDADNRVITSPYNWVGNSGDNITRTFTPTESGLRCAVTIQSTSAQKITVTDPCVHLVWDGERNGEYEPYVKHEYALDSDLELRGIPKLDASNNLYYDGDEYQSDGSVSRRYGIVDMGTLTWVYDSSVPRFYALDLVNVIKRPQSATYPNRANVVCSKYTTTPYDGEQSLYSGVDKSCAIGTTGSVNIRDSAYTDAATFKTAMSGVYLVYELATPTTETATGFTSPQEVGSTESYTDNRAVPIPVGHETRYADIYPITGHDSVTVGVTGINLFDKTTAVVGYIDDADGELKGTQAGSAYRSTDFVRVDGGKSYYIKTEQIASIWGAWYDENKAFISGQTNYANAVITAPNNAKYIRLTAVSSNNGNLDTFGINYPSTDHDYHAYNGQTYSVTLPHTVYGADVDVTGGEGKETIVKVVLDGTQVIRQANWRPTATSVGWIYPYSIFQNKTVPYNEVPSGLISDCLPAQNYNDLWAGDVVGVGVYNVNTYGLFVRVNDTSLTTEQAINAYLSENPITVCYPLATPTDLQTTPTDVELLTGVNNISADGDMELTIADMIESGYYLKELPLTATVTGAGTGGQTSLRIERAESYELDGPDDKTRNGFEGAAAAEVQQAGESQIEVDLGDLIGRLDDGARYRIRASVQDAAGQSAEAEPVEFTVLWNKQAGIPGGTAEIENGVAIITPEAPEDANEGDTVDIYRLSADRPELIVKGGTFGTQYVDPYPTLNEFGGYRIVTVTEYGDYITEDNEMAWTDIRTNNDSLFQYIDFDGNQLELKYNAELSNTWTKQFTATRYLGGSIRGDWLEGTQQEANVNGIVLRDIDQDTYRTLRALGDFSGICHVRTTDGSNFTANINVQSGSTYNSPGHPESVTLTITRVDNPRADGMTLAEWQTQQTQESE